MTNQSNVAGKRYFSAVLATVIATVSILMIFATTVFARSRYEVKIIDGINETAVTTNETEPIEILSEAGITLSTDDVIDITEFESNEGGTIKISRLNTINVKLCDEINTYDVYSATVGDALSEIGITLGENDKLNYAVSDEVEDGITVEILTAYSVTLNCDGDTCEYSLAGNNTVSDLLQTAGVTLGSDDYTKPSADTQLQQGDAVTVYRVEYKTVTQTKEIKYSTKEKEDSSLEKGKKKTVTEGKNGSKEVTYRVKYVNGEQKDKEKVSQKTVSEPVDAVVKVGTKETSQSVKSNGVKSKNGYSVGQKISGKYTHYCACSICNGNSRGITSSGKHISNGMSNPYYVACNWLPLGSVISVDGTNYTVVDRGGSGLSTKGRIDIFTPEGHSACYKYGTGSCTIEIIRLGW